MDTLLMGNQQVQPTWFWLSLFLIIACYFRFDRLWSLRNLDLGLLLLLAPGLLFHEVNARYGYIWFLTAGAVILVRVLVDSLLKRRPRLPQNLNLAGLSFLTAVCCIFQAAYIYTFDSHKDSTLADTESNQTSPTSTENTRGSGSDQQPQSETSEASKPRLEDSSTLSDEGHSPPFRHHYGARVLTILSHLLIIAGLLVMGWRHFGDISLGVSMAALYLLLPYTAFLANDLNQVFPIVLLLGALLRFQHPVQSGSLIGVASALFFFPVFLVPLWLSFYGFRNSIRFAIALVAGSLTVLAVNSVFPTIGLPVNAFDFSTLNFSGEGNAGIWAGVQNIWRLPIFVLFLVMVGVLCWWPAGRTLEILVTRLTALLIGIPFWNIQGDSAFPLWYIPFLLMIIFRPSLSHLAPPDSLGWLWQSSNPDQRHRQKPRMTPTGSEPMRVAFR